MVTSLYAPVTKRPPPYRLRSIGAGDVGGLMEFREGLSPDTIYNRFFAPMRLSSSALQLWAEHLIDRHPARQWSWVAAEAAQVVALLELVPDPIEPTHAEMAIVVRDSHQRRGIGTALGRYALQVARGLGIRQAAACMLTENRAAQFFIRKLECPTHWQNDGELRIAVMTLG